MSALKLFFLAALITLYSISGNAGDIRMQPFDSKSLANIQAAQKGKPFILAFWSVSCLPCVEELGEWGKWQRRYPQVPILLVSIDANETDATMNQLLARHDVTNISTYVFSDANAERVRWSIDRRWRGELPRTYFFDTQHQVNGRSGKLNGETVTAWMKEQTAAIERR